MSADLLAEFGQAEAQREGQPELNNNNNAPRHSHLLSSRHAIPPQWQFNDVPREPNSDVLFDATVDTPASDEDDDDDWGEFEKPGSTPQQATTHNAESPGHVSASVDLLDSLSINDSAGMAQPVSNVPPKNQWHSSQKPPTSTSNDASLDDWGEFSASTAPPVTSTSKTQHHQKQVTSDWDIPSVDDWGDFSASSAARTPQTSQNQSSTWENPSFDDWGDFPTSSTPQPVTKASTKKSQPPPSQKQPTSAWDDWAEFTDTPSSNPPPPKAPSEQKRQPSVKSTAPQPAWDDELFDEWGDFTDGPNPSTIQPKTNPPSQSSTPNPAPKSFISSPAAPSTTVRPTNIPPPSILLELFLDLLPQLQKEATQAKPHQQRTTSSPSPISPQIQETALTIHNTLTTAARVIAGRTHRWKRDTHLSQSMRIGPARAGGKAGGMKLNAVNKREAVKEEQDSGDVLALWRERAALFNTILQAAGRRPVPSIPDPAALKVITARPEHGAMKASHACALCALRRDERVSRVDEPAVLDSFGEWWTEHWGHTECRWFWERNRELLGQR
ncbi:hypothetical protein N7474_009974 [Penicillium riverlandense]|uniref:uncharacterized protein n=1 Tax=Penicillium riverlandense TaxID=1903569 RepID=UPI002548636B|nr:uncharacterized protein N7474_009974 [Penicillium riverlandense]KAJ5808705.1 hypothetical protein N7474_009974 [Penicillium riverlandense]